MRYPPHASICALLRGHECFRAGKHAQTCAHVRTPTPASTRLCALGHAMRVHGVHAAHAHAEDVRSRTPMRLRKGSSCARTGPFVSAFARSSKFGEPCVLMRRDVRTLHEMQRYAQPCRQLHAASRNVDNGRDDLSTTAHGSQRHGTYTHAGACMLV
eukprot:672305-Pleurochrysis_carterae.AAC.2